MRRKALTLCTIVLLAFAAAPRAQRGATGSVTAIVGARLVDGTGAAAVNDSVILVSGDRSQRRALARVCRYPRARRW